MMQGDQYRIPIELKDAGGTFVTLEEVKDMEVFFGTTRKMLSNIYSIIPYLNRDMEEFIKRQRRKEGVYGKAKKGNRPEAV